jgi:type IV pilus assembly protein PilC
LEPAANQWSNKENVMTAYTYTAVDSKGTQTTGTLEAADQSEALRRIKEMGFFPVKLTPASTPALSPAARAQRHAMRLGLKSNPARRPRTGLFVRRIATKRLAVFTRQMATLTEAGLPLLRGLRLVQEQEEHPALKLVIGDLGNAIKGGATFSEALAQHPAVFDPLYINMIKAGEIGGMLETALRRLADFMESAGRIKGKVKAALVYPAAVVTVAAAIVTVMAIFIIPRFKEVFQSLGGGRPLPAFTRFVFGAADVLRGHLPVVLAAAAAAWALLFIASRTARGRDLIDRLKLRAPVFGPVFRKLAISRFARTLGTLLANGVPVLQALNIVRATTGNVVVGRVVGAVRDNVSEGEGMARTLRQSGIFPAMVAGMVEVGEQTGALPEMLGKVADGHDTEVDDAISAMLSLFEPVTIVVLAVIVGSIVIAMFLPLLDFMNPGGEGGSPGSL